MLGRELQDAQVRRLVASEGMVVDVTAWNAAHDYHTVHQLRHNISMHRPGITSGLEVVAWDPPDNSIVINPGIALDSEGHTVVVADAQRFQLQTNEPGMLYLILQYREVPAGEGRGASDSDGGPTNSVIEAYRLEERRELPEDSYIELARIDVSGDGSTITDSLNVVNPTANEIDLRYRQLSGPRPIAYFRIGVVPLEMTEEGHVPHSLGVMSLIRSVNNSTPFFAEFKGSISLNQEIADCDLLVIAGHQKFSLADEWTEVLKTFLDRGGVVFGEACRAAEDNSSLFRQSFIDLADALDKQLASVERGNRLLTSHYLFAQAPDGPDGSGAIVAGDGLIYSDGDYGCLWDGGRPNVPASREAIRSALELGTNLGVLSSGRVRTQSVRMTET
ncbi:MAG: DUF4159 domain-containing protein [Chloroflexi bacterium]|nr:DUF4159 domain-containing protein [Chloroflexota bacterium]